MGLKERFPTDYPLYAISTLDDHHIVLAGGGGSARTGVPNALEIYNLTKGSGNAIQAEPVCRYDTDPEAVMNIALHPKERVIACGMSEKCQLLSIRQDTRINESNETVRRRGDGNDRVFSQVSKKLLLEPGLTVRTDFNEDGPRQKIVLFTRYGLRMITGGMDGHIRIWKYPDLQLQLDIAAHSGDIDEMDVNETGTRIVSVSRDNHVYVWNSTNGERVSELTISFSKAKGKYIARSCRFGTAVGATESLYTVHNPLSSSSKGACYLVKWNADDYHPLKYRAIGAERATKMVISNDGHFLGLGTSEGSVLICTTFNLKTIIRVPNAHASVITGLTFSKCTSEARELVDSDIALISISIDKNFCITTLPKRREISIVFLILVVIIAIYIAFSYMAYLGI
ncbi:Prolactin regulatory element-binding protein [Trichoplax sp. H2]|uniref:Uncharacterized protein n=1 Tax=Trichoplax adhaerens TaxID=10228 RepID=B3S197_TRIAD|nr:hypothetical protein TRIADDRAFT_64094 [Trichoplax adhaerens]EDV23524.1 hypothetical protein TRIADDRAFT_64094 [Trichoplax adhaerens]RDD43336.1 Prolactin regulatory element-binding protein [Trichoplax sp. H2]|eukprot:XP_002114434.1 hypothetical protein TRIADDRAFT_64094 [Trichoplax adhaerens]